ncbi:Hsp20 family protein [Stutzerimonas balearica]|uniref:Hsp20 family protein n=1 Tax=Stutzerimonas balearica TaxID=74829 RepID=UPI003BB0E6CD
MRSARNARRKSRATTCPSARTAAFSAASTVPDSVEKDKIQARFNKGVLMLSMPKKPGAADGERTIAVSKD